jgi:AhpD family alkylhydroperoxidase
MARIPGVPASEAGVLTRLVYRVAKRMYGQLPEPAAIQAHHRGILFNTLIFEMGNQRVLRALDPALRDLALHRVATEIGCSWCVDFGAMLSLRAGLNPERLKELHRYQESAAFTGTEKLAIAYADAMTAQPMQVTDQLVEDLRARLGERALVELTYAIALENHRSRFNHALGITAQGFTSGDACEVPPLSRAASSASRG